MSHQVIIFFFILLMHYIPGVGMAEVSEVQAWVKQSIMS